MVIWKWKQVAQEFKVSIYNLVSLWLAWATWDLISKKKRMNEKKERERRKRSVTSELLGEWNLIVNS